MPKISVITPSIRPKGLEVTRQTLENQTFTDFEWIKRLSVPGEKSDLCYQMNQAFEEAKGELIVFLQDYIKIGPDGLQKAWDFYQTFPDAAVTMPVGKILNEGDEVKWDWRSYWEKEHSSLTIDYHRWEIDWGMIPRGLLHEETFFERYDEGFGWENVDLAYRLHFKGVKFMLSPFNPGVAIDHDKLEIHPYKHRPNQALWIARKAVIEDIYGGSGDQNLGAAS